ncbi:MAG: hypothetical protein ABIJ21_07155 [Nanoarchaeota archaeon]
MGLQDFLEKAGGVLKKAVYALRFLKPRVLVFVLFMFIFFLAEITLVFTTHSTCEFDLEEKESLCVNETLTGLPFLESSIILAGVSYIISAVIVTIYRTIFVKSFFR